MDRQNDSADQEERKYRVSRREEYEQKTEELLDPIVSELGFELVDVEYVKEAGTWYLRAYIDKPGGITVDDCEAVSRRFSDVLDEKDYISDSYVFEVSSPGLGRPLKKEKDFKRSIGEEVEIRTYRAIDRQKEFTGILKEFDEDTVTIEYEDGTEQVFERSEIALMRLALDKQWKLMTNDFNLNKVARVQGIEVLNLNELANVLKPALIAGEWIRVQIMKEGKEIHQGVAYLDDGTMIVVEDGKPYVGQTVEVMVTSILQTSAGRMIFARVDGGQNGQGN